MTLLSILRAPVFTGVRSAFSMLSKNPQSQNVMSVRCMSGHGMIKRASRFQWDRFKDDLHYFIMLGIIPLGAITLYANIRIGQAELKEIPEGYVPKDYEYIKGPIHRWFAKYIYDSYEQEYEETLFYIWKKDQKRRARLLLKKVRQLSSARQDGSDWYFVPIAGNVQEREEQLRKNNMNTSGLYED